MVDRVCMFMKTHLLALLQDNCLDIVHCAFLCKLSACMRNITTFCQHLLRLIKSVVFGQIPNVGLIYSGLSLIHTSLLGALLIKMC